MLIHYVDDIQSDIAALKRAFRDDSSIRIHASGSLDEAIRPETWEEPDIFLLDVSRPDAISLEIDIETVRARSSAPIIFFTGQDTAEVRERALRAGAEAVVGKGRNVADLLRQVAANALARIRATNAAADIRSPSPAEESDYRAAASLDYWPRPYQSLLEAHAPIVWIERTLQGQSPQMKGEQLIHIERVTRAIRVLAERDFQNVVECEASASAERAYKLVVSDVESATEALLTLRCHGHAPFRAIGSIGTALTALECFMAAASLAAAEGDLVHISVTNRWDAAQVVLSSAKPLVQSPMEIFRSADAIDAPDTLQRVYLQLGAALLTLRPQQVSISDDGGWHLTFHL